MLNIDFLQLGKISKVMQAYFLKNQELKDFYTLHPQAEDWTKTIENCLENYNFSREILVKVLKNQYKESGILMDNKLEENLTFLGQKNTITVCTGHQLNLFSGPIFSILKVVQTIKLAKNLKEKYPNFNFVPVYWMATEDHDWQEINHFFCFDRKISWDKNSNEAPVGQISLEDFKNFEKIIQENLSEKDFLNEDFQELLKIYQTSKNLSEAHRKIFHYFFRKEGLIIIDGQENMLKQALIPDFEAELWENGIYKNLKNINFPYTLQVNPREINLFEIKNGKRERVKEKQNFNPQENLEKWSPNVLLRTVYQQRILPNLTYIGGHAEMAYWLPMKKHFDAINLFFPILLPRISAFLAKKKDLEKLENLKISLLDLLKEGENFIHTWSAKKMAAEIGFSANNMRQFLTPKLTELKTEISTIDPTLVAGLEAETVKYLHQLEKIEEKIQKIQKQKLQVQWQQLQKMLNYMLPENELRERKINFFEWLFNQEDKDKSSKNLIENLIKKIDPLAYQFLLEI